MFIILFLGTEYSYWHETVLWVSSWGEGQFGLGTMNFCFVFMFVVCNGDGRALLLFLASWRSTSNLMQLDKTRWEQSIMKRAMASDSPLTYTHKPHYHYHHLITMTSLVAQWWKKSLPANAGGQGSVWTGRFHMPWSNLAPPQLLSLRAREPVICKKRSHCKRSPHHNFKAAPTHHS